MIVYYNTILVAVGHMYPHGRHIQVVRVLEEVYNAMNSVFGSAFTMVAYKLYFNHVIIMDYARILLQCDFSCHKQNSLNEAWYLGCMCYLYQFRNSTYECLCSLNPLENSQEVLSI